MFCLIITVYSIAIAIVIDAEFFIGLPLLVIVSSSCHRNFIIQLVALDGAFMRTV